jgi:Zn-finger nucleic acid-binding protein
MRVVNNTLPGSNRGNVVLVGNDVLWTLEIAACSPQEAARTSTVAPKWQKYLLRHPTWIEHVIVLPTLVERAALESINAPLDVVPEPAAARVPARNRATATLTTTPAARCPSCADVTLDAHDDDEKVCRRCHGVQLSPDAFTRKVFVPLGMDLEERRALMAAVGNKSPWSCGACGAALVRMPIKGVVVDACGACGAGFVRAGQLELLEERVRA